MKGTSLKPRGRKIESKLKQVGVKSEAINGDCAVIMADVNTLFRSEERLKIKIGEAKHLAARNHGSVSHRDVYCAISLDQEEIFRTSTIEKTLNPFFGEEFQFEVPRRFRFLSVYVYDRESKPDKIIGKVAIKREELLSFNNKDFWFPIRPVTADSEVQGKIHLEVRFDKGLVDGTAERLVVKLSEVCDLTLFNGSCDAVATVTVKYTNGKTEQRKTKIKKKTNSPVFDETFTFELATPSRNSDQSVSPNDKDWSELMVTLYHDSSGGNVFLGEVKIPLLGNRQQNYAATNAWYYLQPRKKRPTQKLSASSLSSTINDENSIGSLRLKINYILDHVLPSHNYNKLRDLIIKNPDSQPITSNAAYLLGEIIPCKIDAAQPLVRILLHYDQIVPTIRALAKWEISKVTDANTIFRGNTLVSKMMDEVMRLAGLRYLHETLRAPLERIFSERKPCEIDPTRVKDTNAIRNNFNNLKMYVEEVFEAITSSALHCPSILCQIFHNLKELAICYFPDNKEVRYSVVSGFIFLRFFAPAILGPRLFDLTTEQIDSQMNRTLTLISKTIQSLCNLVSSRTPPCKEEYMSSMYQTFYADEVHIAAVRQFLELISASSDPAQKSSDTPVILKEGVMTKRAQGRKRFGRKNFKQRYFRLTTRDLSYAKHRGKEPLYSISLPDILAVERVRQEAFRKNNMFQIIQPDKVLYVQASNCVEEKEWIDMLHKLLSSNKRKLDRYHPSAYVNNCWQCCRSANEDMQGCCRTTVIHAVDKLQTNVDPDRELARIHALIIAHLDRLEDILRACQAVYPGDISILPSSLIEDVPSCCKTLSSLRENGILLEQEHRRVLRILARETKYGSKQAPIGDDNYLFLLGAGRLDPSLRLSLS